MLPQTPTFDVKILSTSTIFPTSSSRQPTTIPLSIADNSVAKFSRCSAIWYFDPPQSPTPTLTSSHLQASLSRTLECYPHFAGRVHWATSSPGQNGHANRYRRLAVTFNTPGDLGVQLVEAVSTKSLSDFLPEIEVRKKEAKWNQFSVPSNELIPKTPLALSREGLPEDTPHMAIQFTTFSCGSNVLSISLTHCLSDAQTLSNFANDWSSISHSLLDTLPYPAVLPVFSPHLLDKKAAGDIDAPSPDYSIQQEARALPMLRYDWYTPVSSQPWPSPKPSDFPTDAELSPSIPIPWDQWSVSSPTKALVFHFTSTQIQKIYTSISQNTTTKISKHDALLAHLWSRINTARQHPPGKETNMNISLGLRSRLSLPQKFVGSPIMLCNVTSTASSPSTIASQIFHTTSQFTATTISKVLHDEAFEVDPHRLWRGCLGKEHLMVTSWVRSGIPDVDFGAGGRLRWVQPVVLPFDGLIVVMEGLGDGGKKGEEKSHWTQDGVDVCLALEEGAMERLVGDGSLWDV